MQSLAAFIKPALGIHATAAAAAALPVLHRLYSAASAATKRLYVGNLPFEANAEQVGKHFSSHGSVLDVIIPLDHLGRSRGYAFIEMDLEGASSVLGQLDRSDFMGRTIFVNEAHPRQDRLGFGDGDRRRGSRPQQGRRQDSWQQDEF